MFLPPLLDGRLIALAGLLGGLLPSPPQLAQDSTDVCRMVADAILPLDDLSYALSGPDIAAKAIGFRPTLQ
jgi:hypothetical protein